VWKSEGKENAFIPFAVVKVMGYTCQVASGAVYIARALSVRPFARIAAAEDVAPDRQYGMKIGG
jgi:hypothetical protein